MTHPSEPTLEVRQRADALARRLAESERPIAELEALLDAVRALDPRFRFDLEGRPGAIEAVRLALPTMERDLFDAVMEDHACEVAALAEALWQVAAAMARGRQ
jgi:hypothetical protein